MLIYTEMGMIVMKGEVYAHTFLETGDRAHHKGPRGETRMGQEVREVKKAWSRAFTLFSTGKTRQGRINSLVLAGLNTGNRLWSIRADLICPAQALR